MKNKIGEFLATAFGSSGGRKDPPTSMRASTRTPTPTGTAHAPLPQAASASLKHLQEEANQRNDLRDLLNGIVRETMIGSEVLSSNYKYKVLTADGKGLRHTIMIEIAPPYGLDSALLLRLEETMVRRSFSMAKMTVDVFWRCTSAFLSPAAPRELPAKGRRVASQALLSAGPGYSTGFEHTEPHDPAAVAPAVLSGTHYGELR